MRITQAQLLRAVPNVNKKNLDAFVASFNMWATHFGIDTPARIAHYLAQVFTESGALSATSENLNYSAQGLLKTFPKYFKTADLAQQYAHHPQKIANRVYGNRMGNGDESSGDGWKYRGRGYIGLTGKYNYKDFNSYDLCTEDIIKNPDKVANFPLNQICAMWFWEKYQLNDIADQDDGKLIGESLVEKITKKVNGGYNGLGDRKYYYRRFKKEFGL